MTRYTINIGDDFPLGDDDRNGGNGPARGGRHGPRLFTLLRVLFVLALAAIVLSHPVKTALVLGIVLLLRRSPIFAELRSRLRGLDWRAIDWRSLDWRAVDRTMYGVWNRTDWHGCRKGGERRDRRDRDYGAFV